MSIQATLTPTKCGLILVTSVGVFVWILAAFLRDIDEYVPRAHTEHPRSMQPPFPGNSLNHLHWFVQVSDIHISRYYDKSRGPDLEHFCQDNLVNVIKPEVVLASGDLTDGKTIDKQGSQQYKDEWEVYRGTLQRTGVLNRTVWLDIRGNHDTFDVPSWESKENFFRFYSSRGKYDQQSYRYVHRASDGDQFSFVAVDACPSPGPRRPFNFFGMLSQTSMDQLEQYRRESLDSNLTVWFGHYPSSTIGSPYPGFRHIFRNGSVYMCGHLHNLANLAPNLYSMHKNGTLELELGDWKDNRKYRVFAVDHDMFSFTDEVYGTWPVVLVTNPKHAQFNMPQHEPTGRMLMSSHIRILAFSNATIDQVQVTIDGLNMAPAQHVQGPLYISPWDPMLYVSGLHELQVHVKDRKGRERTIKQAFSLDNTKIQFGVLPRFILLADLSSIVMSLFIVAFAATTLPLMMMKVCCTSISVTVSGTSWHGFWARWVQLLLRRLYLVSTTNGVFYPIVGFTFYIAFGPWFIGELLTGRIGCCFVFGLYVEGVLIPCMLTYVYGFFQLITFHIPLILYIGRCLDVAISEHKKHPNNTHLTSFQQWRHLVLDYGVCSALILWQGYLAYGGYYKAYGTMSFLICPVRTWSIFLVMYLRWVASSMGNIHALRRPDSQTLANGIITFHDDQ